MLSGSKKIKPFFTVAALAFLTGCQSLPHFEDWSQVPERKQPQAHEVHYSHDVLFWPASATLKAGEDERIIAFLKNAKAARRDRFYLVSGRSDILGATRKTALEDYLSGLGIEAQTPSSDFAIKSPASDVIGLVIKRYVVTLPGCPDWSGERTTYNNTPTSNWGCATASNLGLMVAEPGDLVVGRDAGNMDGDYATLSISNYRKGETRALSPEDVGVTQSQQKSGEGQ